MKKFIPLCVVALLLSVVSIGCSANGTSSWCRNGSLFPVARTARATQTVLLTSGSTAAMPGYNCDPCEPAAACDPCDPVACNPCDPITCDPCDPRFVRSGIYSTGPFPGPAEN